MAQRRLNLCYRAARSNIAGLLIGRSGCRAGQHGDAPHIACRFPSCKFRSSWRVALPLHFPLNVPAFIRAIFADHRPGQCPFCASTLHLKFPLVRVRPPVCGRLDDPHKNLSQVRTGSVLGKCVETHFVPALAGVPLVIDSIETLKNPGKQPNARCYEIRRTCQTNLRLNRWNERGQAGLERLDGWPFSQASCAAHYTISSLPFAINGPMKNRGQKVVRFPHWPMMDLA